MRRVFAYLLHQRGIDRDIVYAFVHAKMLYESAIHHNAVFVGYDSEGNPRHAHMRGTGAHSTFKCNAKGSRPEYSFHWTGTDDSIYLFEAPIDLMSFITLHPERWRDHSYAAACSVSDRVLFQCLRDHPNIQSVYLCLDNDEAGQSASKRISDKLFTCGYKSELLIPSKKDWNEELLFRKEEAPCQS